MHAYTLGHKTSYDKALVEKPSVKKLGKRPVGHPDVPEGYDGGWVWKTAEEAHAYYAGNKEAIEGEKNRRFAVYRLKLKGTWESDVSKRRATDGVHRLLVDAKIVGRVDSIRGKR